MAANIAFTTAGATHGTVNSPTPPGSSLLKGIGGCYYLAIDDYYILYHMDEEEGLTVLGVLHGPYHPLH